MANFTLAPGYLPECSGLEEADFDVYRAARVDFRQTVYYVDLLPTTVPAIVFGCLAAVGMIIYLAWMCVQHRRIKRARKLRAQETAAAQFATSGSLPEQNGDKGAPAPGEAAAAAAPAPPEQQGQPAQEAKRGCAAAWGRVVQRSERGLRPTWGRGLKAFIVLLSLSLIGVSGWGIAVSIEASNEMVTNFWGVVETAEDKLVEAVDTLQVLDYQMGNLSYGLGVTAGVFQNVPNVVMLIPGVRDLVKTLQTAPLEAKETLDELQVEVQGAIAAVNDKGLGTIENLRNSYFTFTSDLQDTWRFVVIAVVFGLTIVCTAFAMVLVVWMRKQKLASLSVALLWLMVVVLMFLGVGVLKGAYVVSSDACLYAEPFAMRLVNDSVSDPATRDTVLTALAYYFGHLEIEDALVVYTLFGAPTHTIRAIVEGDLVQGILSLLDTSSGVLNTVLNAVGVSEEDRATMLGLPALVDETVETIAELDRLVNRANVWPVYTDLKVWVCCDVRHAIHEVWEAWTVAGALGWVLGAVCSARVLMHTLGIRRQLPSTLPPVTKASPFPSSPSEVDAKGGNPGKALDGDIPLPPPPPPAAPPMPPGSADQQIELASKV